MKKIRFIPYGYSVRDGHTVIDHKEAEIIQEIFKEYIIGASLKDIAEDLTQRKIPYTEKTDAWDKARVSRIIENAKYLGDGEYDPIIDEATFERASACKAARQKRISRGYRNGMVQPFGKRHRIQLPRQGMPDRTDCGFCIQHGECRCKICRLSQ